MRSSYRTQRIKAFRYACKGLVCFFHEAHPRLQLLISLLVLLSGWFFELSKLEWIAVLLCCALVLSLEAVNSAIEKLTDIVHPQWGEKAGIIKDISAGAVLIGSIFAAIVGLIIFLPKIFDGS